MFAHALTEAMPLTKTQRAICTMVADNTKYEWQCYNADDRSNARSFILFCADQAPFKKKRPLLTTLADALKDEIWRVL
jgi:hypothetical protein